MKQTQGKTTEVKQALKEGITTEYIRLREAGYSHDESCDMEVA